VSRGKIVKAIPAGRDRVQSRALVLVGVPVLCWIGWNAIAYASSSETNLYLSVAVAVSAAFGLLAWGLRAATPGAAACGALICFDITVLSGSPGAPSVLHSGLPCVVALFALTHLATRFRAGEKSATGAGPDKHGRNTAQVIANLGVAAVAALQYYWRFRSAPRPGIADLAFPILQVPMVSALAEATADTVSSEIGQALGGTPFLLGTFRRVPRGTDGAISLVGTAAGMASAAMIAIVAGPALGLHSRAMLHVLAAATAGLFFDSLLGATAERRGWIGNDAVNFASTCFAGVVALFLDPAVFG
jgi:uncharacterized protein (TIGR00297 family)